MNDRREDPEEHDEACDDVCLCPPRGSERTEDIGNLGPIEGKEAHSEPTLVTEELVDDDVFWSNPAYPGEVTESLEKITRKEVPRNTTEPDICEEPSARETPAGAHASIGLSMQSVEECTVNQVQGPN